MLDGGEIFDLLDEWQYEVEIISGEMTAYRDAGYFDAFNKRAGKFVDDLYDLIGRIEYYAAAHRS